MNRARVVNSTWEALAECDLLAKVLNEHSVSLLRFHLHVIRQEIAPPIGNSERVCGTITAVKQSGPGDASTSRDPASPALEDQQMSTVRTPRPSCRIDPPDVK